MSGHLFTDLAEPLLPCAGLAVLRLDFLSFVAVVVVVMTFANRLGILARVSVIGRTFCHVYLPKVADTQDSPRRGQCPMQTGVLLCFVIVVVATELHPGAGLTLFLCFRSLSPRDALVVWSSKMSRKKIKNDKKRTQNGK